MMTVAPFEINLRRSAMTIGCRDAESIPKVSNAGGKELGLLQSCAPLFAARQIRFAVISTHHSSISESVSAHADCLASLKEQNANILCEHDVDESFSGDGLIVAAMRPEDQVIRPIPISRCRRGASLYPRGY